MCLWEKLLFLHFLPLGKLWFYKWETSPKESTALTFSNTRNQDAALDPRTGVVCHQEMRERTVTTACKAPGSLPASSPLILLTTSRDRSSFTPFYKKEN